MYSLEQARQLLPIQDWATLLPDQHESLAAFRVRFSEFQEHMGKTMKAVALEEEKPSEPFTAVNQEYEDDPQTLHDFFEAILASAPELLCWHEQLLDFCARTYPR